MGKFFNITDIIANTSLDKKEDCAPGNSKALQVRFEDLHHRKVSTLKELCGQLPDENEVIFIQTTNSFNAFTFIVYLLKHAGKIDKLLIKTYWINIRILDSLSARIRNNEISETCLYIAESIRYRMPRVKDQMDMMIKEFRNFSVEYAWTHQKVICIRIAEDYYVVEGSGNFSENSAEEQYIFMKSKKIYEFRSWYNT